MYSYELKKGISMGDYKTKLDAEIAAYNELKECSNDCEKGTFTVIKEVRLADLIDVDALIEQIYRTAKIDNVDADDFIGGLECDSYGLAQALGACISGFVGNTIDKRNGFAQKREKVNFLKHGECVYFSDRDGITCGLHVHQRE